MKYLGQLLPLLDNFLASSPFFFGTIIVDYKKQAYNPHEMLQIEDLRIGVGYIALVDLLWDLKVVL